MALALTGRLLWRCSEPTRCTMLQRYGDIHPLSCCRLSHRPTCTSAHLHHCPPVHRPPDLNICLRLPIYPLPPVHPPSVHLHSAATAATQAVPVRCLGCASGGHLLRHGSDLQLYVLDHHGNPRISDHRALLYPGGSSSRRQKRGPGTCCRLPGCLICRLGPHERIGLGAPAATGAARHALGEERG